MRKILACLLLVCLALPLCHAEEIDESQYVGVWIEVSETINRGMVAELMCLTEDHRVFYIRQTFDAEKPTLSYRHLGTWTPRGSEGISIEIGDGFLSLTAVSMVYGVLDAKYASGADYKMFVAQASDMMTRMANEALSTEPEEKESGVYIPAGFWTVGEDIPAGVYSVRNAQGIKSQNFFVEKDHDNPGLGNIIVNTILGRNADHIGKIELKEGYTVTVYEGVIFDVPDTLGF